MELILSRLKADYRVYAPKRLANRGWKPGSDLIRYVQIDSVADIVHEAQSHYSPKDVFYPIVQTILHFTEQDCRESELTDSRKILLLARPCDINGIRRLDEIFLKNGGQADFYYQRLRDKLKICLLECRTGWDNCFCVAMGANRTDDYSMAVRFESDGLQVAIKDQEFDKYFCQEPVSDFTPQFVQVNLKQVKLPEISSGDFLRKASSLALWDTFNSTCISCGSCNTVCITCSCFDTTDIIYHETSRNGERRRVWSSCMLEDFTRMAGGHSVRKTAGERMRFRTLHKVYDYKARFGGEDHMCVGCGRCDSRCPAELSFSDTINQLSAALASEVNRP
jgi:anaerobic sulfite reductase subunit A